MPENNGNQNTEEYYTNKYQKHIACNEIDDKISKPFKSYVMISFFSYLKDSF